MHNHVFMTHCLTLASALVISPVCLDSDVKHLTLIRINSGREEANSPN